MCGRKRNGESMDFRSLTYFVTVAEELNITHAAEKLNLSQPPLSTQIRQLEEELGAPLFIRGRRSLQLTDAGRTLYRRAQQILSLAEDTRQEISSLEKELSGKLRIGVTAGRAPYLTARCIAGFSEEYPLVTYSLWNGSSDDVIERLYRDLADVAVIAAPYDSEHLDGIPVGTEPWVALIPAAHPLAQRKGNRIPLKKLSGEKLILPERSSRQESIMRWFSTAGIEPVVAATLTDYTAAVALTEQGVGIAIMPQTTYTPNHHLVSKLITGPSKIASYVLVWRKDRPLSGLPEVFRDYVKDEMEVQKKKRGPYGKDKLFPAIADAELL